MIRRNTVFVLGAGASLDYGYPLGEMLRTDIIRAIESESSVLHRTLTVSGNKVEQITSFYTALRRAGGRSVDQLLEHRSELMQVGKDAIAAIIGMSEDVDQLFEGGWYPHLFEQLNSSFEDFGENELSIVTFNYDRSLDEFLFQAVLNKFGKSEDETASVVKEIPIIHVHGSLGPLPWQVGGGYRYGPFALPGDIRPISSSIKIIHESTASEDFKVARQKLSNAELIVFIGFGYHETNMRRLFQEIRLKSSCRVIGSFVKMYPIERYKITRDFEAMTRLDGRAGTGKKFNEPPAGQGESTNALQFLRSEVQFS